MFLKSLILRGFKTFADLTEIEFSQDSRITAIVGPNGCGKSNTLDATRWALGEDNPRELRVNGLSNIIFAGTAQRKALSLAEVSLVFDNASGKFSVPYSEVSIKRRTFREGESEFFINKNQCRLKDIKDLLLDTGLGEGTYSIITQGQVDAILSSKGEERRNVFEEAAGINKYKTRKISAQKKLIAAEQNTLRINDLRVEVGEQLISLEEQAKKAQEYIETQKLVKESEIGLCKKQLKIIIEKRKEYEEKLAEIKKAAQVQEETEQKDVEKLQDLRVQVKNIEQEIENLLIKLEEEKDRLRDIELDCRFMDSEIKRSQEQGASLEEEKKSLINRIEQAKKGLDQESQGMDLSSAPLGDIFIEIFGQFQALINQLSSLLISIGGKNLTLSVGGSKEKEEAFKIKLELLEEEFKKLEGELEKSHFALEAHLAGKKNLDIKNEENHLKNDLTEQISSKRQEKEKLSQIISELENKIRQEDLGERKKLGEEATAEIALAKLETEMSNICEKLYLEYSLSLEEALEQPYEISNITKAKKEVELGKVKLRELEPVNLLAVEEFEKSKERLSFIEVQLADLNSARENLQNLINELDAKAQQTFIKTMEQLSEVFSETFATLFSGGEAKIFLSNPESPLDSEIEISVRPSGRKWLPLTLLSGGERSLSAIAILFSLLKIRPSPFCFLDEVDAALDDANVERFARMLKDFSDHSQILVITHNKRTMAIADTIYGITMEEPGVSKVISMKLSGANA